VKNEPNNSNVTENEVQFERALRLLAKIIARDISANKSVSSTGLQTQKGENKPNASRI
jgi:hypothetical protein